MGAPSTGMQAGEQASAEALLGAFKTIKAAERRKHASVLNYWLSIRGDKEFPPLHDLDPLELSDAGPNSALLELISGGHDAEIRHLGEALRGGHDWPERIMDAASPSLLSCIGKKLPIVAISRDFLAFEDEYAEDGETIRCWVTLLPLSAGGAWVDYVYALVSLDPAPAKVAKPAEKAAKAEEPEEVAESADAPEAEVEEVEETEEPVKAVAEEPDPPVAEESDEPVAEEPQAEEPQVEEPVGSHEPAEVPAPAKQAETRSRTAEGPLQTKLTEVRAMADEARMAKLRANAALYEGLSAAYDFALDAEERPDEYLRLVEAQGLKIQLRSPMKPVVKLAFDGMCDDATIKQLEAVLAWAFDKELPRGALAGEIESAGGIARVLNGEAKAA